MRGHIREVATQVTTSNSSDGISGNNMSNEPPQSPFPLPPPSAYSCPHCGFALQEAVPLCPNCGARIVHPRSGASAWSVLGAIALALLALPLGLSGACFAFFGAATLSGPGTEAYDMGLGGGATLAIGIGLLGVAALCVWGLSKLLRKR